MWKWQRDAIEITETWTLENPLGLGIQLVRDLNEGQWYVFVAGEQYTYPRAYAVECIQRSAEILIRNMLAENVKGVEKLWTL